MVHCSWLKTEISTVAQKSCQICSVTKNILIHLLLFDMMIKFKLPEDINRMSAQAVLSLHTLTVVMPHNRNTLSYAKTVDSVDWGYSYCNITMEAVIETVL